MKACADLVKRSLTLSALFGRFVADLTVGATGQTGLA